MKATMPQTMTVAQPKFKHFNGYCFYISFYSQSGIALIINPIFQQVKERQKLSLTTGKKVTTKYEEEEAELRPEENPFYEYYQNLKNNPKE